MKPYLLVVGVLGAFTAGLLIGSNAQPILVGGGGTPANSIQWPATSPRPSISAPSGALTLSAGGSNQNITLIPSGTGIVGFGNGAAADIFASLNAAAAQNRALQYRTAGTVRWSLFTDSTAEAGANVGSDFRLNAFDDAGSFLTRAIFVKRSTGKIGLGVSAPTNPAYEVDVTGDVNASGVFRKGGTAGTGGNTLFTVCTSGACITSCTLQFNGGIRVGGTCP